MTREERNNKLKYLITCMKCEVSGKSCDEDCPTQYNAGNIEEIIENLEEISKILEQEPCEDCISRQAVLDKLNRLIEVERLQGTDEMGYGREHVRAYESMIFEIESEYLYPPVTPKPKTGHWEKHSYFKDAYICSSCNTGGNMVYKDFKYCPNCGAKMEVEE